MVTHPDPVVPVQELGLIPVVLAAHTGLMVDPIQVLDKVMALHLAVEVEVPGAWVAMA
jgi:hypothetical protein